jgi:serine/threonine-protein kinase
MIEEARWAKLDALLEAALDRPEEERSRWLREACEGDVELESDLSRLVALAEGEDARLPTGPDSSPLWADVATELAASDSLPAGTRLGPYEVFELIGRGGMGSVYRALDPSLGREVAIKALSSDFASDPSNLRRFEREAKVLASLNHPNIAAIYDLLEVEGERYLILELVSGETLGERLARGALALDELLAVAAQLAEALEEAHRKGIVHRDLKPSNVKLTERGRVKILDFGLARESASSTPATLAPPTTGSGVVLGTPGYMSPEQARGQSADKRADIWAFGCLLYEMLTGQRAFTGATVSDAIAAVLRDEVSWERLPAKTPPPLERLIRRCLKQDPHERLQDIGDARIEIAELSRRDDSLASERVPRKSGLLWGLVGLAVLASFFAGLGFWRFFSPTGAKFPTRAALAIGPDVRLWLGASSSFALSPDGSRLAFVGERDGRNELYLRKLDSFDDVAVRGSEGARDPFFSPDSAWVAFFAGGELRKASISRPVAETIAEAGLQARGGSWGENGEIVFAQDGSRGLLVVAEGGGAPRPLSNAQGAEHEHLWPHWLPGGESVLFTSRQTTERGATDEIAVLVRDTGAFETIGVGSQAVYVPTGHLVYVRNGALEAAAFDSRRRAIRGARFPIVDRVQGYPRAASLFSISGNGTLVYLMPTETTTLDWVSPTGDVTPIESTGGTPGWPRISPDGRFAALHIGAPETRDIWILDLERPGSRRQLTVQGGGFPVWSADGNDIAFMSRREGNGDLFTVPADGSGAPSPLVKGSRTKIPVSWSVDGALAFYEIGEATQRDIFVLDPTRGQEPVPFATTPANELSPAFSPDGRLIAYVSNETGRNEVYVRPYPPPGPVTVVSIDGGTEPVWGRGGQELFYRRGDSLMVVEVTHSRRLEVSSPQEVLRSAPPPSAGGNPSYDVSPDGAGFLMLRPAAASNVDLLHLVIDWFSELREK